MSDHETKPLEPTADADRDPPVVKGRLVGRYVLLGRLGSGGSGDVFSAFDPTLDRRVAVKLLHAHDGGPDALIREGRLLAKLLHPSVVTVHDLGIDDGQPYLAMELIDGPDIVDFAQATRDESHGGVLLAALRDVGEGLAAAHRIGLVHGDIKPSNILRDNEGRTKLSDFGIAQLSEAGEMQAGAGTPAFMAPEQHAGKTSSELADQYSFCLTAFVLSHGEPPFIENRESFVTQGASNDTPMARTAGAEDRLRAAAQQTWTPRWRAEVPSAVARAFERGLSLDPAARWPSMDALLEALRVRSRRRVGPWLLAVGGVAAATGTAVLAGEDALDPCARAGESIDRSWNAQGTERLRAAWSADSGSFSSSLEHVITSIDGFSDRWRRTSDAVCKATHEFGLQSPEMLDVRSDCLRRAQVSLEEVIDLVSSEDPEIWAEAAQVAQGLPDPRRCAQAEVSTLPKARTAHEQQQYEDAERLLERARYAVDAVALERAATALASAEAQVKGQTKLEVLFLRQQARLLDWQGKPQEMQSAAKRALHLALQQDDIVSAVAVASLQAQVLGQQAGQLDEARDYAAMALALSGHPDATAEDRFTASVGMGSVLYRSGESDAALIHFRTALVLGVSEFGESHPNVAGVRTHIASTLQDAGRLEEALVEQQAALESRQGFFGPDHPSVAQSHHNLSRLYYDMGRPESEHHTRRALEILIAAFGPKQMPVAMVQGGLGDEMRRQGRHEEALELYDAAIETLDELIGYPLLHRVEGHLGTPHVVGGVDALRVE
ncbi:MAG: serine/threonine-protein kinase [Candidatus Hydrogenedentes bacterium]|nr:serine/threonine-protein kinase [Candidatus Hydrogenedentota bacterium]